MVEKASAWLFGPGAFRVLLASVVIYDHFFGVMIGRAAVFVFFVLSGFWIHRMWTTQYANTVQPYLTFMISRLWRLMPVMLLATGLALAVQLLLLKTDPGSLLEDGPLRFAVSHLLLLGYSGLQSPRLLEPAWSLDLEMQFYLIAPLLVLLLTRAGTVAFVAVCAALYLFDRTADTPAAFHVLAWFAIGMLSSAHCWRPSRGVVQAATLAAVGLLGVFALSPLSAILTDPANHSANILLMWALALLAVPMAVTTCFVDEGPRGRLYGNFSYILYLVHWPFVIWSQHAWPGEPLAKLLAIAGTVLASVAIWYGVDRPLQRARARWVQGRITSRATGSIGRAEPAPSA